MKSLITETEDGLAADGWKIAPGQHSRMPFYAWQQLDGVPDCASNEKPPCACVEYYSFYDGDRLWESCEVGVAGDVGDGQWVKLSAYNIAPSQLFERLPDALAIVKACWIAAVSAKKQK